MRAVRLRVQPTTVNQSLMLVLAINANRYTMSLYRYDVPTAQYIVEPILIDADSQLWGDGSNQWSAWSFLYELYRVNDIGMDFAPATFAGIGSQSALVSLRDPVGYLTSLINNSSNLPADLFREYVSDA